MDAPLGWPMSTGYEPEPAGPLGVYPEFMAPIGGAVATMSPDRKCALDREIFELRMVLAQLAAKWRTA